MHGRSYPQFLFIEPVRSDELKLYESRLFKKISHKTPSKVITEVNVETKLDDVVLKIDGENVKVGKKYRIRRETGNFIQKFTASLFLNLPRYEFNLNRMSLSAIGNLELPI